MSDRVLAVILARAASKGLPDKCVRPLLGRAVLSYTLDHVAQSRLISASVLTTDSQVALGIARAAGVEIVERPAALAGDAAAVCDVVAHAVSEWETRHGQRVDAVVILYGNVPVRAAGLLDRAIEHWRVSGADSVRSVAPVGKFHPDWMHRLDGDRMLAFRENSIHRRQELEPLFFHDGAVIVLRRTLLVRTGGTDPHAFFGQDRRAIVQPSHCAVDIDDQRDLLVAEAALRDGRSKAGCVVIGTRRVGTGEPLFVVAEAGINHDGRLDRALALVDAAVDAGADAVKFQVFSAAGLATAGAELAEYQKHATAAQSQREMLASLELSDEQLRAVRGHSQRRGIQFIATAFSVPDVGRVTRLDPAAIKIASTDLTNVPLVEAAAKTGLPVVMSCGASTAAEIDACVRDIRRWGAGDRLVLLHCVSRYPTPVDQLNLGAIGALMHAYEAPVGLSDHSDEVEVGAWAVCAGACVLEKHFTLDRRAPGPDHAMSLSPQQLKQYIDAARRACTARGEGTIGLGPRELAVREVASKSVVASAFLAAGTVIGADHLTLKRPGTGIAPRELPRLVGRRAVRDIPADTTLTWDMVR